MVLSGSQRFRLLRRAIYGPVYFKHIRLEFQPELHQSLHLGADQRLSALLCRFAVIN